MKIKYFILALGMLGSSLVAQTPEKITFKDTQNHYLKLVPKGKPEGLLIILPGGGETGEGVMNQVNLDELALEKNLIVLFPTWEDGDFGFHIEQKFLDRIVKDTVEKHKLSKDKISIGGLSGGGMLAFT
jgi:poly(3-hydroxybutyrate) depolymerase